MDDPVHWDGYVYSFLFYSRTYMTLGLGLVKDIEDALDELRDATVNRDITRADKIKKILLEFLEPEGYTLVEDPKLIYRLKTKG